MLGALRSECHFLGPIFADVDLETVAATAVINNLQKRSRTELALLADSQVMLLCVT